VAESQRKNKKTKPGNQTGTKQQTNKQVGAKLEIPRE
jgi:hypothetical protein